MRTALSRRGFLSAALGTLLPVDFAASAPTTVFINGHIDPDGNHHVSGFDRSGDERFRLPLPDKAHGFAVDPVRPHRFVCLPTLPGTRALVVDAKLKKATTQIRARSGYHFFGHGCFSRDGKRLYVSENHVESAQGVIGVYDANSLTMVDELPGYGIGPHDIHLLPDDRTLVIASGGIKTHPSSGKRELNINTMQSSLVYIDGFSGELLSNHSLPTPRLSIRHLDVSKNGSVIVACQYKGRSELPPLVGLHTGGSEIKILETPDDELWPLQNYTASARFVNESTAVVSCPRGNRLTLWDLEQQRFVKSLSINDVGGIEVSEDGHSVIASANTGELYQIDIAKGSYQLMGEKWVNAKWTNHMNKVQL
ncbi:MAG: DUF1513 domain-containing protein [Pseudomonadota bacterium]